MTKEEFRNICQAAYGSNFTSDVAKALNVSDRTIRYWLEGSRSLPENIDIELVALLGDRVRTVDSSLASMAKMNSEIRIAELIALYESECDAGSAQGKTAQAALKAIQASLQYRGRDYCTLTLARYGSKRSIEYIRRGLVDNHSINSDGEIIGPDGKIVPRYC
ncbi:hypothetical protein MUA02_04395 [Enterobacteriaceae bacterium H20N1]|uniref:Uncharacterized protein n=1 Tax=Dryocola boscaweniae TaxID=2925397 RepID=A0A9X2W527_9ENTR|nr:hypothetical protein [Dryocola boscaweniae]MCT4701205.1 hypothetical protein [Dryocola boscaweniae]MCT4718290.1 hypothetical protein [Dryocola boscaweniae]